MKAGDISDQCRRCKKYLDEACWGLPVWYRLKCFEPIEFVPGPVSPETGKMVFTRPKNPEICAADGPTLSPSDPGARTGPNPASSVWTQRPMAPPPRPGLTATRHTRRPEPPTDRSPYLAGCLGLGLGLAASRRGPAAAS